MKEDYFDKAISFVPLYKGLKMSCRNVRWKDSVVGYEHNGLRNTYLLEKSLKDGSYKISKYQKFEIHEPKQRIILASRIQDRQFQRSLCECGLYEDITEHFIYDNCACQRGKGTDFALKRMKTHLSRFYRKHGTDGFVLKCDIHHYFPETDHEVAKAAVRKYVSDKRAAQAVCDVIDSFGGTKGIGLGSQISQLVQLLVLNDLDHYIKEKLRIKHYIRYMDDFILIHESKEYLRHCLNVINAKLKALKLTLNEKTSLFPLRQGLKFLKWKYILTDTGRVLMLIDTAKVRRQKKRMVKLYGREREKRAVLFATEDSLRSFIANCKRGDAYRVITYMKYFYREFTGENYHAQKLSRAEIRRAEKCRNQGSARRKRRA